MMLCVHACISTASGFVVVVAVAGSLMKCALRLIQYNVSRSYDSTIRPDKSLVILFDFIFLFCTFAWLILVVCSLHVSL